MLDKRTELEYFWTPGFMGEPCEFNFVCPSVCPSVILVSQNWLRFLHEVRVSINT